jgi:hypothetical protein
LLYGDVYNEYEKNDDHNHYQQSKPHKDSNQSSTSTYFTLSAYRPSTTPPSPAHNDDDALKGLLSQTIEEADKWTLSPVLRNRIPDLQYTEHSVDVPQETEAEPVATITNKTEIEIEIEVDKRQKLERLTQRRPPGPSRWTLQAIQHHHQQEAAQAAECTFKPQTGRGPLTGLPPLSVEQRLLMVGAKKKEALRRLREELEDAELAECTFAPQLIRGESGNNNKSSGSGGSSSYLPEGYVPPQKRVLGRSEYKNGSVKEQSKNTRVGNDKLSLSFQPRLNKKSLEMAAALRERRHQQSILNETTTTSLSSSKAKYSSTDDASFFVPVINASSRRIVEDSTRLPADFQQRLQYYRRRQQLQHTNPDNTKSRNNNTAGDQECTFMPKTSIGSLSILAQSDRLVGALFQGPEERSRRLAYADSAWLEARRRGRMQQVREEEGCSFHPVINEPSSSYMKVVSGSNGIAAAAIVAARPEQRLLKAGEEREARIQAKKAEIEALQLSECTFKPNTYKPAVAGYHGQQYRPPNPQAWLLHLETMERNGLNNTTGTTSVLLKRIQEHSAMKEARAKAAEQEKIKKELKECSFKPRINDEGVGYEKGKAVLVAGIDKVMERREEILEKRQKQKEWEDKVFKRKPKDPKGITVPKPFTLSFEQRSI